MQDVLRRHTPTGQRIQPPRRGPNGEMPSAFALPDVATDAENEARNWPAIRAWVEQAAARRVGRWERLNNNPNICVIFVALPEVIGHADGRQTSCIRVQVYDEPGFSGIFNTAYPTRMTPACLAP